MIVQIVLLVKGERYKPLGLLINSEFCCSINHNLLICIDCYTMLSNHHVLDPCVLCDGEMTTNIYTNYNAALQSQNTVSAYLQSRLLAE